MNDLNDLTAILDAAEAAAPRSGRDPADIADALLDTYRGAEVAGEPTDLADSLSILG